MDPSWSPSDELLARFLREDCALDETRAVQGWLTQSSEHARRLERLRRLYLRASGTQADLDRMWTELRARSIDAHPPAGVRVVPRRHAPRVAFTVRSWLAPIAATLLFGVIGTAVWYGRTSPVRNAGPVTPDVVYQTRRGQTATVRLSDGSQIRLAPESRLVIPGAFGDSLRELALEGEAVFDVHHDTARPFRVRTRTTLTEDIGTKFNVRAYGKETQVSVAVAEGAVTLARLASVPRPRARSAGVLLHVGDLGTLERDGSVSVVRGAPVGRALAWTRNQLVFVKQPLPDVLATIARWYDLDIQIVDPQVAAHPVTARFSTQSVDEMLQSLAIAVEGAVQRDGRRVTLRGRQ